MLKGDLVDVKVFYMAFLGNVVACTGVLLVFAGFAGCLRRLRRRFFPVGPVVLSKVTASTRTGVSLSPSVVRQRIRWWYGVRRAWDVLVVIVEDERWPWCFTKWNECSWAWLVVAITWGVPAMALGNQHRIPS
jgi:hypothetical protein